MGILIALFVLMFLILLLSMPLIIEARGRIGVRGAVAHVRIYLLGLIPVLLRFRLYLFENPYFTMVFGKNRIFLLKRQGKAGKPRISGVKLLRLDTRTTVGIGGDPAAAVLAAGTAAVLFSMLTTRIAEGGSAQAGLCETPMFRIAAKAQAIVFLVPFAIGVVLGRIARRKAANNIGKSNEKRTTYASC